MSDQDQKIDYKAAEDVLLGTDPTEDWTEEQRAQVAEIMKALDPPEPPPKYIVSEHFKKGERIRDIRNGITIVVLHAGEGALRVNVIGKKVRWGVGHIVNMQGQRFVVQTARRNEATLNHLGPSGIEQPNKEAS